MAIGHRGKNRTGHEQRWLPAVPVPRGLLGRGQALAVLSLAVGCADGATAPDASTAPPPPVVTLEIPQQNLVVGEPPVEVDLSDHFSHPDGDSLTFAAAVSDTSVASVAIAASLLRLAARANGATSVNVTATDSHGGSVATRFPVVVAGTSDRAALLALYEATDGPNWVNSENWLTDAPLGDWYGVEVDGSGRVIHLDLSGTWDDEGNAEHGLTGAIPSALADLARLASLGLGDNRLTGAIPPELGDLAGLEYLDLSGNTLTGAIPPELGNLDSLETLSLWDNTLTGTIPAALGELASLEGLDLSENLLTGAIPPELGSLRNLRWLDLSGNGLLDGRLPPELGNLASLEALWLRRTGVGGPLPPELGKLLNLEKLVLQTSTFTGPIPPELGNLRSLTSLDLAANYLEGPIPSELGNLRSLEALDLALNHLEGAVPPELGSLSALRSLDLRWNGSLSGKIPGSLGDLANLDFLGLDRNRLTGPIPPELGKLSRLERLGLSENRLTGPVPATLAGLGTLRVLGMHGNALSGPLPEGMGALERLEELWVGTNPELSGPLPLDLTGLTRLQSFKAGGTGLCAPDDEGFLEWLAGVPVHRVARCEAAAAYLTQAVQSRTNPVPLIAGQPALLRAFVASPVASDEPMPAGRATFFVGGSLVHEIDIEAPGGTIPRAVEESEGSLERSLNVQVPAEHIRPGLEFVVEVDPAGALDPALGVTGRMPAKGRMPVDVVELQELQLTVVPFLHETEPDSSILAITRGMADDPETHPLLEHVRLLLPVGGIDLELHNPVVTSDSVGFEILHQTEVIRQIEGRPGYWLGMAGPVRHGLLGVAWDIPSWSSFSQPLATTIAHEIGHNMGLWHAPCGGAGGPDPLYPHPRGVIDTWGYDMANGRLVSPYSPDLMTYCGGQWIGDYHRANALRHRLSTETDASLASRVPSLVVWGGRDRDGRLYLEPSFITEATPTLPPEGGEFSLRAITEGGGEAFSLRFDMPATHDAEDGQTGFVFSVPVTWTGALASIVLSGRDENAVLNRDTDRPISILRDRTTGRIRAFLRGRRPMTQVAMDATQAAQLDLLFSAGIPEG